MKTLAPLLLLTLPLITHAAVTVTPIPTTKPAATTTTKPAVPQDGPGLYRISAGPNHEHTAVVRAKSRADALNIALKTVAQKAMDHDENVNINKIKVERIE